MKNEGTQTQRDDIIGYDDAARETGLAKPTLYAKVSQHAIPHIRLGPRLVRFSRCELRKWIDEHRIAAEEWTR